MRLRRSHSFWFDAALVGAMAAVVGVAVVAGTRASGRLAPPGPHVAAVEVKEAERKDNPDAAMRRYLAKRSHDARPIPYARYRAALRRMETMRLYSTPRDAFVGTGADVSPAATLPGTWEELGPGNIGGRTRALVVDPTDADVMYAAGVAGGVWKTTDGGGSWNPLADLMPNLAVTTLAMDPDDPDVLYAGTGEGFGNLDGVRGAGIFKTTDGGLTWLPSGGTDTDPIGNFHYVNDIVVSEGNSQHVYAATWRGVFMSLDGGANWTDSPTGIFAGGADGGCLDLAIRTDVLDTDVVFASCGQSFAVVYRHSDIAGDPDVWWDEVLQIDGMGRTSLAISPSNQNYIYALSASSNGGNFFNGLHAVYRSTTGGDAGSWTARVTNASTTKLNTVLLSNPREATRSNCGQGPDGWYNQGWYDNVIAVDPVNPDIVFAGGIDLFRSNDGGMNWGHISRWDRPPVVHADQHAIAFHPAYNGTTNKTMWVGNDGGVHETTDARAAASTNVCSPWMTTDISVPWTNLNNGYGVTQFYDGAPYPNGQTYFGGAQDNGTLRGSDATGLQNWEELIGGDGGYVAVDPNNTDILYGEFQNFGFLKSTDGGVNWDFANSGVSDTGVAFITPFVMDPSNSQRLWTGGDFMWRTVNGAGVWSRASSLLLGSGRVSAIAVAPSDANRVLVGLEGGPIHYHHAALGTTSATSWLRTEPRDFWGGWVSSIAFHPTNANIAYATYSTFNVGLEDPAEDAHVWKTANGGLSWTELDGTGAGALPNLPVHSIAIDPSDTQRLYIGTDLGVFVSIDGGANWAIENTGFANVVTEKLAIVGSGAAARLFAFTHGRGAWRTPLTGTPVTPPGAPTGVTATAGNGQATVSWTAPASDGGSPITNYIVTPYVGATPGTSTQVGNVLSTAVTGLANGTSYTFKVKAKNASGEGPESAASNAVTPVAPAPNTIVTGPSGTHARPTAVFTLASDVGGAGFECRVNGGAWTACTSPYTRTNLYPGRWVLEFRAVNVTTPDPSPEVRELRVVRPFVTDWDANGKANVNVWRPSSGGWLVQGSPNAFFGRNGDVPVPAQWDADAAVDRALWRPASGGWYIEGSATQYFGSPGDVPVPGQWDADPELDRAVWRPASGGWYVQGAATSYFGSSSDVPVPGDYDADPALDKAVFRPANGGWYVEGSPTVFHGQNGDIPVPADWNGDGKTDIAVFRPANGTWYLRGISTTAFGASGDIPMAGDFDADAGMDKVLFRPTSGAWYVDTGTPITFFGVSTDVP